MKDKTDKLKSLQRRARSTIHVSHNKNCKNKKEGDIILQHIAIMSMLCRVISPYFYFYLFFLVV